MESVWPAWSCRRLRNPRTYLESIAAILVVFPLYPSLKTGRQYQTINVKKKVKGETIEMEGG